MAEMVCNWIYAAMPNFMAWVCSMSTGGHVALAIFIVGMLCVLHGVWHAIVEAIEEDREEFNPEWMDAAKWRET